MVIVESLERNPVCMDISEGLTCRAGRCPSQSVSQEGSWRYRSAGMKWPLIFLLQFLFTQYLSRLPLWAPQLHVKSAVQWISIWTWLLGSSSGFRWIAPCSAAQDGLHAERAVPKLISPGTGRALPHHTPAWTQIKFSHFWVAESPC